MVPVARYHDTSARPLLGGVSWPANSTPPAALETVLDSVMAHPNTAPFIGKQLIQHLVSSNPTPGLRAARGHGLHHRPLHQRRALRRRRSAATSPPPWPPCCSTPRRAATAPARQRRQAARAGADVHRRAARAQRPQRRRGARPGGGARRCASTCSARRRCSTSTRPTTRCRARALVGPAFGIHNANTALERLNFLTYLLDWGGSARRRQRARRLGTAVDLSAFEADAADAGKLVDRLSVLATGAALPAAHAHAHHHRRSRPSTRDRQQLADASASSRPPTWCSPRPHFQVQR